MKRYFIFILAIISTSCFTQKKKLDNDGAYSRARFLVISIDSTSRNYIIYLQHKKSFFKVVSAKKETNCGIKIVVGERYIFNLESIFIRKFGKHIVTDGPISNYYLDRAYYNGEDIFVNDNCEQCIREVFQTKNLRGLCYIRLIH